MLDIWHFAITSTRRETEICRLLWEDNDPKTRTGLVQALGGPDPGPGPAAHQHQQQHESGSDY